MDFCRSIQIVYVRGHCSIGMRAPRCKSTQPEACLRICDSSGSSVNPNGVAQMRVKSQRIRPQWKITCHTTLNNQPHTEYISFTEYWRDAETMHKRRVLPRPAEREMVVQSIKSPWIPNSGIYGDIHIWVSRTLTVFRTLSVYRSPVFRASLIAHNHL